MFHRLTECRDRDVHEEVVLETEIEDHRSVVGMRPPPKYIDKIQHCVKLFAYEIRSEIANASIPVMSTPPTVPMTVRAMVMSTVQIFWFVKTSLKFLHVNLRG